METITLQTALTEIVIRREKYAIKKGDYVLYNGCIYQFFAADGRILKKERWGTYSNITLTKKALKNIPFDKLRKTQSGSIEKKNLLIKWYF